MVWPFKQIIAQLKAGLTNNGKNNSYKSKLESLLNLNIIDAILRDHWVFFITNPLSHIDLQMLRVTQFAV